LPFQGSSFTDIAMRHINVLPSPPDVINPAIPASVGSVVLKALAKRPEDRYGSVQAFAEALERAWLTSFTQPSVLFCYAHQDERLVSQLKNHLSMLEHNGLIALWDYGSISPGTEWGQEIDKHLDEAQIILLFISASFLASKYCYREEMQRAIERHERKEARVI